MELPDRDKREAEFAAKLAKAMSRHRAELKDLLGDPPDPDNVPQEFWDKVERETSGEMVMPMFLVWTDAAVLHGMERDFAMRQAQEYAIGKAFKVSRQMTETSKRYVRDAFDRAQDARDDEIAKHEAKTKKLIDDALAAGDEGKVQQLRRQAEIERPAGDILSKGEVIDLTTKLFGPKRAAGAAENETVRAQNSGIKGFVMSSPKRLVAYWRHSELREPGHSGADVDPCDICTPMEGLPWTEWGGLEPGDAHPGCDCFPEILSPEEGQFLGPSTDPEGLDDWAEEFGIPNAPSPVGALRVNESLDYGAHLRTLQEAARDPELRASIRDAARTTDRTPTESQARAGNYSKGKVRLHGLVISIETPKGAVRHGRDGANKPWSFTMRNHYGYIAARGSIQDSEADGDKIDVFVGPDPESELAFVIDQLRADGTFDEHKVLLGWHNEAEARQGYLDNYPAGWNGLGNIKPLTIPDLKEWLVHGDTSKPIAESLLEFRDDQARDEHGKFAFEGGVRDLVKEHEKGLPRVAFQPHDNEADIFQAAVPAQVSFVKMLGGDVAKSLGAEIVDASHETGLKEATARMQAGRTPPFVIVAPIKGVERSRDKVANKYKGDWRKLGDVVRGTIVVENTHELGPALDALRENMHKDGWTLAAKPDNKFARPTKMGYRDVNLALRAPNGMLAELQVNTKPMFLAKMGEGHKLYEESRVLDEAEKSRPLTPAEDARLKELTAQQRELFGKAWKESHRR